MKTADMYSLIISMNCSDMNTLIISINCSDMNTPSLNLNACKIKAFLVFVFLSYKA